MPQEIQNKPQFLRKNILVIICFLCLFFLSFRFFFETKGIVGHNWDWAFPGTNIFSDRLNIRSIFTWDNSFLGYVLNLDIALLIQTSFFALIAKLFGLQIFLFLLFFSVAFISFISFKKLLDFLLKKSFLNYIPSFLYSFSPFLFNDIIGGAWMMWVSYAVCPLYFVYLVSYFENGGKKNLFLSLFLLISIIISIQNFVLINLLVLFYLVYKYLLPLKLSIIRLILRRSVLFIFLTIIINFYWIFPFSYSFLNFTQTTFLVGGGVNEFSSIINSAQGIWNIFNLGGYFNRNMYLYSMSPVFKIIFQPIVAFAFIGILFFFMVEKNKNNIKKGVFWLFSLLILILVVKGGNDPFSGFTLWLYQSFPVMRLYRSPQHLMLIPALIIPILLAISFDYFYRNILYKKSVLTAFSLIVLIWINSWWYNGDLGHKTLLEQGRDHVDFFSLPPELIDYYKESKRNRQDYRAFFLPAVASPDFLKTEYQNKANGIQPEYKYLYKSTFSSESSIFANKVEISFCRETNFDYVKYLSLFSVKDIVLRSDIRSHFTKSSNCWDNDYVRARLDASAALKKFLEGKYTVAYKINDVYFLPHFYIPQKSIYWKGNIADLTEILDLKDYQLRSEILLDTGDEKNNLLPQIGEDAGKEIFVKSFPVDLIKDEELGTYKSPKNREPLEAKVPPGSLFYPLVLKMEELDLKSKKTLLSLLDYNLLLADKKISGFLIFGSGKPDSFGLFLFGYTKSMDSAVKVLEEMKVKKDKNFLESLAKFQETLVNGERRIKIYSFGGGVIEEIEKVFRKYGLKVKELKPKHDFTKSVYQFSLPKEGEYEIYVKDEEKLASASALFENGNWQLLETKYFNQGENEYSIENSNFGENLVTDSFKINDFTEDTVYRVSMRYRSNGGSSLFSVNQSQEGKLFDYFLPKTGNEQLTDFEMYFRSSEDADKAFINLSVPEYADLKIEKIRQPEILLKLKKTDQDTKKETPKITFAKVNPTKYRILVEGAREPYSIVFSESFHKGWKVYVNIVHSSVFNVQSKYGETVASYFEGEVKEGTHRMNFLEKATFETWGQKPLPEERHYLVNGYANAWRVLPTDVGNSENYELIVEFEPQRLYYIGLFVSFATLGTCFVIMIVSIARKKKSEIRDGLTN